MKDFRGSYFFQPNGSDNKSNRVKEYFKYDECECFTPFVKVHHFDCPLVKKPCPVHGEKLVTDPNRCMFISFHPSLRNDNLFQPVQNILTQSYDDPLIKNQYFLQKNAKYIVKNRLVQTRSEDLKNFSNSYIAEKKKSFVADKTSKIKKLKQCFHSPCESVTQKSQSQTSIKEKVSGIFWDNLKLTKDASVSANKELTEKSLEDMCLVAGTENDYNSDGETPLHSNNYSTFSKINNIISQHMEGHLTKSKNLNDSFGKKLSICTPYICYTALDQESNPKIKVNDHDFKKPFDPKKKKNDSQKDRPGSDRDTLDSEASSISTKSANSESSGSVFYTPIILVPEGMDKKSNDDNSLIPFPDLIDKDCQTSRKNLFREISACTQTTSKFDQCTCVEKIKNSSLFNSSAKKKNFATTQTSTYLISNTDDIFVDEGTPRALNTYSQKHRSECNKSEIKPLPLANTLKSEHKNEQIEMFDDEGTPPGISLYNMSYNKRNERGNAESKEKLKKNMKNVEVQSEDSTQSSSYSSKSEGKEEKKMQYMKSGVDFLERDARNYKTDEMRNEGISPTMSSYKGAQNQKNEHRNIHLEDKNQKNTSNKEMQSEDSSSSSTSKSIETSPFRSPVAKSSPVKARSKLLDDEFYNVPQRPKNGIEVKDKSKNTPSEYILLSPKTYTKDKHDQDLEAKKLEMAPVKLSKKDEEHKYRYYPDYNGFDDEGNHTLLSSYDTSPKRKLKNVSRNSLLDKHNRLSSSSYVEEKFEKNNSNEKMLRLRSLEEELVNWPNNMKQIKDPILQEVRKSQEFVLKNTENLPSPPKTSAVVSNYKSKPIEITDDVHYVSPVVSYQPNKKKYKAVQNYKSEEKDFKNKICKEEELLNSLEEEISEWPDTMNFCKETLLEQIQKCRNSKAMLSITSKEPQPSDFKNKHKQSSEIYDDDQSSQILDSYNFSQINKDKSPSIESKCIEDVSQKMDKQHLRSLSEEIRQLPDCEGFCREQLLDWVRRNQSLLNTCEETSPLTGMKDSEHKVDPCETFDDEKTNNVPHTRRNSSQSIIENDSQRKINKREIKHLSALREESSHRLKDKETSQNELFDWVRRNQSSCKDKKETASLKSTETQILQHKDQTMETREMIDDEKSPHKKEHENQRCKSRDKFQKKIKNEEEAFLKSLEEEVSCWSNISESCRNMLIKQIRQYRHLRSRSVEMLSSKSIGNTLDCKCIQPKEIFCSEKVLSKAIGYNASQKKKQTVNSEDECSEVQKVKQHSCDTVPTTPIQQEDEINEKLQKNRTKIKNTYAEVRPTECEDHRFEIKKPLSYKSTAFCHTSIKFSTNSNKLTQTGEGEFTAVNIKKVKGSHTTYVLNSFSSSDSDENVEKIVNKWIRKSHSDGHLFEKKNGSTNEVQLTQTCYCDPAQLQSNTSSNDSSKPVHSIFDKKRQEEIFSDRKQFIKGSETSPNVQENCKTKKQQKSTESRCDKDQIECVPVADFSELYQIIHQRFDEMSSKLMKVCKCQKFTKPKDHEDKAVMTDSWSKDILPKQESPKKFTKREILTTSQIIEKPKNLEEICKPLICDKCAKEIISSNDVGTNTDITWSRPKTVEKGIGCEINSELRNETKFKEKLPEKVPQRNNKQNLPSETTKDIKLPTCSENHLQPTKNADSGPSSSRQNDLGNKAKTVIPKSELKNNENKTTNEQTISKKIELNCETLKKNITISCGSNQKSPSSAKLKPKESPRTSRTRVLDNTNTKKLMPEPKTTTKRSVTKNSSASKQWPMKLVQQSCSTYLLNPTCAQPSTSRQTYQYCQNCNHHQKCICSNIKNQDLYRIGSNREGRPDVKLSPSEYATKKKNNLKKNSFLYRAQVLQPFFRILEENLIDEFAEFADYFDIDLANQFLKAFDRSKQKRNHENENNSDDDVPTDKKYKIFEFGKEKSKSEIFEFGKENSKSDDECYHYPTELQAEEISLLDLEKLKKKSNFFQNSSFSNPEFSIMKAGDRDTVPNKFYKSEETLKKTKNRQKFCPKRVIHLPDKFLDNENCQPKSTGYLNCIKNQQQKLIKCNVCKSFTYLKDADRRPILKFQEYLLNEKAKNDSNFIDKIFLFGFPFKLNSFSDEECTAECERNSSRRSLEEN